MCLNEVLHEVMAVAARMEKNSLHLAGSLLDEDVLLIYYLRCFFDVDILVLSSGMDQVLSFSSGPILLENS